MAVSPQLQAAIAAHRFGLGEPDLDDRRPRRRRLARGADRPGRSGARQRACSTRRRRSGSSPTEREKRELATQSAAGQTAEQVVGRPLPRDPDRRCALAPRHRRGDASGRSPSGCTGSGPTTSPSRSSRARPAAWSARSSATRSGRTSPAASRPCWSPRPPIRRCCATSTTGCRPGRTRGSSPSRRGARRGAARARASPASTRTWRARCWSCTRSAPRARASGAYTQADVTAFAAVLTGWRVAPRPRRRRQPVRPQLARARAQDRARQELSRRPRGAARGASRPGPPSGHGPLRRHQAGAPLRRRRAAAGAGRPAGRGLPEERRPARRRSIAS